MQAAVPYLENNPITCFATAWFSASNIIPSALLANADVARLTDLGKTYVGLPQELPVGRTSHRPRSSCGS